MNICLMKINNNDHVFNRDPITLLTIIIFESQCILEEKCIDKKIHIML